MVPGDGRGEEWHISSLQLMTLQKKNKKASSYSSRKQNDLGVPGFFFFFFFPSSETSYEGQTLLLVKRVPGSPVSEVSGEESPEKILPRDKCKRPPFIIHVHFQTAHKKGKGCSQQ